jgi:hypothetical protein
MNLVTKADIKRFLQLLEIGLKEGKIEECRNFVCSNKHDGTDVIKEWFVSLDFTFKCSPEAIHDIVDSDSVDDEIKDMIKNLGR